LISEILSKTNFCIADCIIWKKKSAVPNSTSKNKLTRICEFVFVFCRKDEFLTFETNKKVKSVSPQGQNFYEVFYNFVEAKNNDGSCNLNKATYSSELCCKLIEMYVKEQACVLDPFMGTGTTAVACVQANRNYIGFELSKEQCEYAKKRISETVVQTSIQRI
jgi:DNA modification methylase